LAPVEDITRAILVLRGHRVILDADLAALYGVTTKRLNEQVKRNAQFPKTDTFVHDVGVVSFLDSVPSS
jgi:hypothetical protein